MKANLVQGNSLQIPLADQSVHCIVTSPPYWGLRQYSGTAVWSGGDPACDHISGNQVPDKKNPNAITSGTRPGSGNICRKCGAIRTDAQLGVEPLHDCLGWAMKQAVYSGRYVRQDVAIETGEYDDDGEPILRWEEQEVPEVAYYLDEYSCGECYVCHLRQVFAELWRVLRDDGTCWLNLGDSYNNFRSSGYPAQSVHNGNQRGKDPNKRRGVASPKEKDLCGIPWRVALALQADGWYLRSDIIWHKPAPMPESVRDRPTKAHEYIFLLTKQARYFWDQEAVKEGVLQDTLKRYERAWNGDTKRDYPGPGPQNHIDKFMDPGNEKPATRNIRTVWTIAPSGYSGQHFATFPPGLPERCIKAGTSEAGVCSVCGKQWGRVVKRETIKRDRPRGDEKRDIYAKNFGFDHSTAIPDNVAGVQSTTIGFRPSCTCNAPAQPALVLDPFNGASTTGLVCQQLNRRYVGLDLSMDYLLQSRDRLGHTALDAWKNGVAVEGAAVDDLPLFSAVPHQEGR